MSHSTAAVSHSPRHAPTPPPVADSRVTQNDPKRPIGENSLNDEADALTPKQRVAIELLAAGKSLSQVAAECGVSRKTLYRWRHEDADFVAELKARRRELWGDVTHQVRALLPRAIGVIAKELDCVYDRARVDAAKTILRLADVRGALRAADAVDEDDKGDDHDTDADNR